MDDKDKIDVTETDILYGHLTSTTSLVEAISLLERKTDKPEALAAALASVAEWVAEQTVAD